MLSFLNIFSLPTMHGIRRLLPALFFFFLYIFKSLIDSCNLSYRRPCFVALALSPLRRINSLPFVYFFQQFLFSHFKPPPLFSPFFLFPISAINVDILLQPILLIKRALLSEFLSPIQMEKPDACRIQAHVGRRFSYFLRFFRVPIANRSLIGFSRRLFFFPFRLFLFFLIFLTINTLWLC